MQCQGEQRFRIDHASRLKNGLWVADITLLARYYERFADHAVTIGMRVVHIVTGEPYVSRSAS